MLPVSDSIGPFLEDASGYRGHAAGVFAPATVAELRAIVQQCAAERVPLTVSGAGTGLTGARVPQGGYVISLHKFRKLEIEPGRAHCGAGTLLRDLHEAAAASHQFFGPNPTEDSASIGGIVSTNAGGARSFRYRSVRYHVLALEVTFMSGETALLRRGDIVDFPFEPVHVPGTTKNSAGYALQPGVDWPQLLAGSEGTLGLVTEVELELQTAPRSILSGVIFFSSDEQTLDALENWRTIPELRLLEYLDRPALELLGETYPEIPVDGQAALMVEQNVSGEDEEAVETWLQHLQKHCALEDSSWFGFEAADRERFRAFRHTLPSRVTEQVRRNGFPKCSTDFAVPFQRHRELHSYYQRRCRESFPSQYTIFGHAGDANNHINLLPKTPHEAQAAEDLIQEFAELVVDMGGTVAAEHGIGKSKTDLFRLMFSEREIAAMRQVKRRLDPDWLLGQGTLFES